MTVAIRTQKSAQKRINLLLPYASVGWAPNVRLVRGQSMNLTPMPRLVPSSLGRDTRDHRTSAWDLIGGLEGSLTITKSLSPSSSGLWQRIKAPWRLKFSVSPSITPAAVTILAGNLNGILGSCRFSTSGANVFLFSCRNSPSGTDYAERTSRQVTCR